MSDWPRRATGMGTGTTLGRFRWGLGASIMLHTMLLAGVLLIHHVVTANIADQAVELVMLPVAAPAVAQPEPTANPVQPVSSVAKTEPVAIPVPQPVVITQSEPTLLPLVANPAPRPTPRVTVHRRVLPRPVVRSEPLPAQAVSVEAPASPAPAPSAASAQRDAPARTDPAWLSSVGQWLLAHRTYPQLAREMGRQGTVVVQIVVEPDGHVATVTLVQGSGSDSLDHAAEALVRDARLPPFPPDMTLPRQSVTLPIRYRLE